LETGADRRIVTIALALLLAWSLALRVWLATPRLDGSRFWDESYGVYNVYGLLARGQLRPLNGYHPGLSYLPQAALLGASEGLHRLTGRPAFAVIAGEKELTPTGYLLCRLVQALAGTLSLYLTFSIGRRLASPGVGLAAALFLALVPWHLRQSVIFKPDIELVACSLLALRASLAAADRPDGRTSLAAGAAVGLALAAKFNAAPAAVPLGIALLGGGGWRRGRRWGAQPPRRWRSSRCSRPSCSAIPTSTPAISPSPGATMRARGPGSAARTPRCWSRACARCWAKVFSGRSPAPRVSSDWSWPARRPG
jgi:hypothetical protein